MDLWMWGSVGVVAGFVSFSARCSLRCDSPPRARRSITGQLDPTHGSNAVELRRLGWLASERRCRRSPHAQKGCEMPKSSPSGRQQRREQRRVADNLHAESVRAQEATTFTDQYRRYRRRRVLAYALIALGGVVAFTHVLVHLGNVQWLATAAMQDLLTGYPMGGLLIVVGLVILGRK
jgi:uncharacterized membrane protein (DUF485 family)